jgi:arabinofuranosyltransferase
MFAPTLKSARLALWVGLLATLILLLAHSIHYWFLTDDAYISFRYARNLSEGHGLVFNPGFERVEGYTNFLWVLILAGCHTVGLSPETAAPVLSMLLTVVLWGVVVSFVLRHSSAPKVGYLILVPPLLLAATRSFAVWSTSGLETRLFELLVVSGTLRLILEDRKLEHGDRDVRPIAALLLALGTLTRPDGLLIGLSVFASAIVYRWRQFRDRIPWLARSLTTYGLLVGGHFLFRLAYYGETLPNTYYAKVGGQMWWAMGLQYLESFFLEYAIYLWIPFLIGAVVYHRRHGTLFVPVVIAAVVVPHALYNAAIGGDHFEFRPLDLYFPLAYLLVFFGAVHLARTVRSRVMVTAGLLILVAGAAELPYRSHVEFPKEYTPGFPGMFLERWDVAQRFLDPSGRILHCLPGFNIAARRHQDLIRSMTKHFVGIRQEEHEMFLDTVIPQGKSIARLVENGTLPKDTYVAVDCVGAIPYYSDLRVLDRLGLTDARIARGEFQNPKTLAHGKYATPEYAKEIGVDLWAVDNVHPLWRRDHPQFGYLIDTFHRQRIVAYFAEVGDERYLLTFLPQGLAEAEKRFPELDFLSTQDTVAVGALLRSNN